MELTKGDDHPTEHAATLLGSPRLDNQMSHEKAKKRRSKYCIIVLAMMSLCLLVALLAVLFLTKNQCDVNSLEQYNSQSSCRKRCGSGTKDGDALCDCDPSCEAEGTCCLDYQEVCLEPTQLWTCSRFRCGEERLAGSLCSCSDDCVKAGDCCENHHKVCKVQKKAWLEEECEDIQTLKCPAGFDKPPLILVSMDGFRAGYLDLHGHRLPVLSKLRKCGTSTPYMRPVYPTKTFPNHYTLVTGLYPESHGIVDNKMYDPTLEASFSLKSAEKFNPKWYQGEPVWLTAMDSNLKSGIFFWPGSDVDIKGRFPDFYMKYDKSISFERRVAQLFEWLSLPKGERPDFYTLYMDEPDSAGHRYGPTSSQVIQALLGVDKVLGQLMEGLNQRDLIHCVNMVVLSDHGMEEASCEKAFFVSKYHDNVKDFTIIPGPAARIRPNRIPEEWFSFDYEGLVKNLSCKIPDQPMRPYLKEHLPKRMHFANNQRIERGHLYMKPTWQAALSPSEIKYCYGGFHGSDNLFRNMQTIFIGYGPGLKYKESVPPFENIEVYNLLCDLLNIPPAPNNGSHGSLNHLLRSPVHLPVYPAALSHNTPCEASDPAPTDDLGCTCVSLSSAAERALNKRFLQMNFSDLRRLHLPYGIPKVLQTDADFCILHHSDYINGYSKDLLMPLWVAYTLQPLTSVLPLGPESKACVRADVRVPAHASQMCPRYKNNPALSYGLLHPPNLNASGPDSDSLVTSNMAPMFPAFEDIWTYFHNVLLPKYSLLQNGINVMSGPVFDHNYDGNFDTPKATAPNEAPIPSHFFVILTSCKNSTFTPAACEGPLQVQSFILPHRPDHTESCATGSDFLWVEDWAQFHIARVRDVELLTGLSFYHDRLSVEETLQLKTFLQNV